MADNKDNNNWRNTGLYVLLAVVVIALAAAFFGGSNNDPRKEIAYSDFIKRAQSGEVARTTFMADGTRAEAEFKDGTSVRVNLPPYDSQTPQILQKAGVSYEQRSDNGGGAWFQVLGTLLFPLLLLGGLFLLLRRAQNGAGNQAMNFGKSKARVQMESQTKTTFQDVAGVDEAKLELVEVVDFLKNRDRFDALGAKIPRGVLLVGPPGTGKTLLAKAVAGEAGVPFFSISGSEFVEMFVGVGASRVRDLFEQAKRNAPCIVFIDEIDAVGRSRGAGLGGGNDEREQTLNQLLVEMDGFEGNSGVIILAATNRPDVLDAALLRPGRFDRQVTVDRPDLKGRLEVLKVHARGKTLARDVDVEKVARRTPGFTGADLANLLNEAAILAARRSLSEISMDEINDAIDRVLAGPEKKNRLLAERTRQLIAYHEVGHALLGRILPNHESVQKVSIIPRGMAAGLTWFTPSDDDMLVSRAQLLDRMATALGGRVAEELVFGNDEVTTGASNDLERVASMARTMVTRFGMSDKIGPMAVGRQGGSMFMGRDIMAERDFSEQTAGFIDEEVKRFVDNAYHKAKDLLQANRGLMELVTAELLKRETLDAEELEQLVEDYEKQQLQSA